MLHAVDNLELGVSSEGIIEGINLLSNEMDKVRIYEQEVSIVTADVKTLNTSPVVLAGAPGVDKYVKVLDVEFFLDYESVAYVVGATYDLSVEYETAGQMIQESIYMGQVISDSG